MNKLNKKTIDDVPVSGKRVLVRCDFNVPFVNDAISDDTRIVASIPTIKRLLDKNAKVILCSHLGKPEKYMSLQKVAEHLSNLLNKRVKFIKTSRVVNDEVKEFVRTMNDGDIILLENTRLRPEEMECGETFSMELASLCDIFVNDAFGTAHRAHASNVGVSKYVNTSVSGYLMKKEIENLMNVVENPRTPFVAILGGAKVKDKLKVIDKLLDKCDTLLLGGGMAYTFLKAMGYSVGTSLVDDEKIDYCKKMLDKAKSLNKQMILPIDCVCVKEFPNPITDKNIQTKTFDIREIPDDYMGLDIGEKTIKLFITEMRKAKTIIWNGPVGLFENQKFALGTYAVARTMADLKKVTTVVGGGDSASAVKVFKFADKMTHVSTGGGATLEYLEGVELPGVVAISNK